MNKISFFTIANLVKKYDRVNIVYKLNKDPENIENANGKWIQYRAIFDTDNGSNSPILKEVEISFE